MTRRFRPAATLRWLSLAAGAAAGAYAAYSTTAWLRYGRPPRPEPEASDPLLDRFIPDPEIAERHHVRVRAPAAMTYAAACEVDLEQSPFVRGIFRGRELILGSQPARTDRPRGLLALTKSLGWGVLAEVPGREIVMGAVTRPWEADVVFRSIPPDDFAGFAEPGFVKIAWTLRADPVSPSESIFRTETRVVATDANARTRFRRYWALLSPGIIAIRRLMLAPVKAEAERRARAAANSAGG